MRHLTTRRTFLLAAASLPLAIARSSWAAPGHNAAPTPTQGAKLELMQLERRLDGRLGVFALDTATGAEIRYRAGERFPICSTFKVFLVSAILERSRKTSGLLQKRIAYTQKDLVPYSPITERHVGSGMTVAELCAAAIQYSDNTAANQLIKILGGPAAVTAFARSMGNRHFRLDRWETDLNTAIPGDLRDTSTPDAMGCGLQRLALKDTLGLHPREQLQEWLRGSTTGAARIRAGVPADWKVGDKTGTGDYGTANDLAVLWPPHHAPLVLAVYTTQHKKDAKARNDIIAAAAQVVAHWCLTER